MYFPSESGTGCTTRTPLSLVGMYCSQSILSQSPSTTPATSEPHSAKSSIGSSLVRARFCLLKSKPDASSSRALSTRNCLVSGSGGGFSSFFRAAATARASAAAAPTGAAAATAAATCTSSSPSSTASPASSASCRRSAFLLRPADCFRNSAGVSRGLGASSSNRLAVSASSAAKTAMEAAAWSSRSQRCRSKAEASNERKKWSRSLG
mmetsp:Transcript_71821/g.181512  ORF Transcript_71821/g.181512 Transcript_71821/m.181512 type:complete len:208 (-) Transcript_71821:301-924(-)